MEFRFFKANGELRVPETREERYAMYSDIARAYAQGIVQLLETHARLCESASNPDRFTHDMQTVARDLENVERFLKACVEGEKNTRVR